MRDNLIFYNVEENDEENSTEIVHSLLECHFKIQDAKSIKIDRAHRMGKKQRGAAKPRAIVAKFNYFPDKVRILANAKNLKQWRSQRKMFGPASSAAGARVVGGSRGILPRKILKTRTPEMPFSAIWALTYESQFH